MGHLKVTQTFYSCFRLRPFSFSLNILICQYLYHYLCFCLFSSLLCFATCCLFGLFMCVLVSVCLLCSLSVCLSVYRGVHPPCGPDAFPPAYQFPPYS